MALVKRRWLLIAVAAVLVGAAGLVLVLRWALDPATVGAAAESRLSAMLGQPVSIGALRVSLFPSPALTGSDIRIGGERAAAPALELDRIRLVPQLSSVFSRPIVIRDVALEGLVVSVLRDQEGRWHVPAAVPAPTSDEGGGVVIRSVRLQDGRIRIFDETRGGPQETASIDDLTAQVVAEDGGLRLTPITGRIGDARIEGSARVDGQSATVDLEMPAIADGDLPALLGLAGSERPAFLRLPEPAAVEVRVRIDGGAGRLTGKGAVRAPQVAVDPLRLEQLRAPVAIDGSRLTFDPTTFRLYGGTYEGSLALDLSQSPPRWSIDSGVKGLDAGAFLSALTGRDQRLDGTADLRAALGGRVGEALDQTVKGRAHVDVSDGVVREFPLLATINRTLKLAEGDARDTRFERLSATLAIADARATTDDLVMQAREIRVEARGWIGFDRTLDLRGVAVLSPERTAAAIRSIHELAALRNEEGELEIPLTITGTADDPSIALDLKAALGQSLKEELKRRLRGIIRPPG